MHSTRVADVLGMHLPEQAITIHLFNYKASLTSMSMIKPSHIGNSCHIQSSDYVTWLLPLLSLRANAPSAAASTGEWKEFHSQGRSAAQGLKVSPVHAGKLVTVRGLVMRAGPIRQLCLGMDYMCTRCCSRQGVEFPEGATVRPSACSDGCRSRSFSPILDSAHSVAWQRIRLQVILQPGV